MRIAILGGTGQIGVVISREMQLKFPEAEILACSRSGKGVNGFQFNVYQKDWTVLGKLDVLVNAVGIIEETGENTFQKIHVGIVNKMVDERESLGNPKIIHVSVLGSNKDSPSKYAATKGIADNILKTQENWVIIRPSFVCTPGTTIVQKVKMLHKISKISFGLLPIPTHFLTAKFQPVMGEDVAHICIESIRQNLAKKVIYATGPELYTLEDWLRTIGNGKIRLVKIPKWLIDRPLRLLIKAIPQIMNTDQYLLLGEDNTHDNVEMINVLGRLPLDTKQFWEDELV
jgi:NADH dehydrogenase|tara:strand:- start:2384 stop:3244 length:861 start_codon:yes stop_codon:yes gene_type:complete